MYCRNLSKRGNSHFWYVTIGFEPYQPTKKDNPVLNITHNEITYKPIQGYEGIYWVSDKGVIRNSRQELKTYKNNGGYECIKLTKERARGNFTVHRLVAIHFIPTENYELEVNHINGNKYNNSVNNLEWVTSSENKLHALRTGIRVYNLPTKGIKKGRGSIYRNVSWDKNREKWVGSVRHNKINYGQKRFDDEIDAAKHVNYIIDTYNLDRPKNDV
jgi:hypothetical protein